MSRLTHPSVRSERRRWSADCSSPVCEAQTRLTAEAMRDTLATACRCPPRRHTVIGQRRQHHRLARADDPRPRISATGIKAENFRPQRRSYGHCPYDLDINSVSQPNSQVLASLSAHTTYEPEPPAPPTPPLPPPKLVEERAPEFVT